MAWSLRRSVRAEFRRSLRTRLVASLVVACAITLLAATLVLLLPLEHRLRSSEVAYLRTSATHAASAFAAANADPHAQGPGTEQRMARQVARFTHARVILADRQGRRFADTDRDLPVPLGTIREALSDRQLVSSVSGHHPRLARATIPVAGTHLALTLEETLRPVRSTAATVRSGLQIALGIALATAVLLGLVIGRGLSKRLRRLRDGALRVAELGIDEDLPADETPDEIGDLAGAFRVMQRQLRRQEEARQAFVGTSSHELRTPLTTLNANLELLVGELDRSDPNLAAARDEARRAQLQAQRLSGLATDLLELSRLDAGVPGTLSATDLVGTCRAVLSEFAARADASDVALILEARGERAVVHADPNGIAQVVRILVDNGLRFAPSGSRLTVTAEAAAPESRVTVADEGVGVPAAERELIFERFRRGTATGGESGFGLGLAIGRELAERMGGTLSLADHDGPGAMFVLRLPTQAEPGESQLPSRSRSPRSRVRGGGVQATPS